MLLKMALSSSSRGTCTSWPQAEHSADWVFEPYLRAALLVSAFIMHIILESSEEANTVSSGEVQCENEM